MRREVARLLRSTQAYRARAVLRQEPHREADGRERVAACPADLEGDPAAFPAHRSGHVHGSLRHVRGFERCVEVASRREVAVQRKPGGEGESRREVRALAGPSATVVRVARVAGERETRDGVPRGRPFELPRPGVIQPPHGEAEVRARPVVADFERALREGPIGHDRIAAHAGRGVGGLRPQAEAVVARGREHAEDPVASFGVPIRGDGALASMPARAQGLVGHAPPGVGHILGLDPQVDRVEGRARRVLNPVEVVVVGDEGEPEPRAPPLQEGATVVRCLHFPRCDADEGSRLRRALARADEIHPEYRGQHDHVDSLERRERDARRVDVQRIPAQRQVGHAVPVDLEACGAPAAIERDLGGAVDTASRDVHARDVRDQIREGLHVREHERIGGERVPHSARQRSREDRLGERGEVVGRRVACRRVGAGGGVAPRRGVDLSGGSDCDEQERGRG